MGVRFLAAGLLLALATPAFGDDVDDALARARGALDEGRAEEALAAVRKIRADHPDDDRPVPLLAFLLVDRGDVLTEAMTLLTDYVGRRPGDAYALDLLRVCAERSLSEGDPELARLGAKVLMLKRGDRKEDVYLWAEASFRMGQLDAVRDATRRLIASWPSFEPPYWLLAKALEEEGRLAEAIAVYQSLLREQSGNVRARLTRASLLLWALRKYDAAEQEYRSALELAEPGSDLRAEIEFGLRAVAGERDHSLRLRRQNALLTRVLAISLAVWAAVLAAATVLLRSKDPGRESGRRG